jgi:hypothetical protein
VPRTARFPSSVRLLCVTGCMLVSGSAICGDGEPRAAPPASASASAVTPDQRALADAALTESGCAVISAGNGALTAARMPSLHVLEATAITGAFSLPADAPPSVQGIMCARSSIVPAPNDYKVVMAGFAFYISVGADADRRLYVLERPGGQFRLRATQGTLTPEEQAAVRKRLDDFQEVTRRQP